MHSRPGELLIARLPQRLARIATALAVAAASCLLPAHAEALYAVTLRNQANLSTGGIGGNLYTIDPDTGAARIVAPLRLEGQPIGLRGIAIHPKTRVFYGITAGLARNIPRSLVTFDPSTGDAKLIGALGLDGSDINFDEKGTLYIWLQESSELGTVDVGTGMARAFADSGVHETIGGGFAIDHNDRALLSATSAVGTIDSVDLRSGHVSTGPHLTGAPFVSAITAMDFSAAGTLYAVNTNLGSPAVTALVSIDPRTGAVRMVGALPNDTTAIAFGEESDVTRDSITVRKWMLIALAAAAVFGIGFATYASFKARKP